jgi:hypothetical protein
LKSTFSRARSRISGRYALVCTLVLAISLPAVAIGAGEGRSITGGKRNPSRGDLNRETQIIASNGSYGTRQSNKGAGGGAIYGCRAAVGAEPCVRANNLTQGRAFEFETDGKEGGRIAVQDTSGVPFTTNAEGKVANLNADKLDDKSAEEFEPAGNLLFAAVAADGGLGAKRGATASGLVDAAKNTYAVTFNRDVSMCVGTATAIGTADAAQSFGVLPNPGNKAQFLVDQVDDDPGPPAAPAPSSFHLQVIC